MPRPEAYPTYFKKSQEASKKTIIDSKEDEAITREIPAVINEEVATNEVYADAEDEVTGIKERPAMPVVDRPDLSTEKMARDALASITGKLEALKAMPAEERNTEISNELKLVRFTEDALKRTGLKSEGMGQAGELFVLAENLKATREKLMGMMSNADAEKSKKGIDALAEQFGFQRMIPKPGEQKPIEQTKPQTPSQPPQQPPVQQKQSFFKRLFGGRG
jgi:hypothetical protein